MTDFRWHVVPGGSGKERGGQHMMPAWRVSRLLT